MKKKNARAEKPKIFFALLDSVISSDLPSTSVPLMV
jgi:hypothetical protein